MDLAALTWLGYTVSGSAHRHLTSQWRCVQL